MNHKAGDAERALEKMSPFQLKEEEYSIWDRFVDQQKEGTIYHLSSWKGFLEETFPHIKGTLIAVRDMNSGDIVAGIPLYTVRSVLLGHRVVSTPFATLGGILGSSDREVGNLCATILEIGSRWGGGRLEIRGVRDLRKTEGFPLFPSKKFLHHYLELPDTTEELLSKFSRVVRRNLIKAEKAGVRVHDDNSAEILRKFSLMHQMERKRLGLPAFPLRFFAALRKHLPFSNSILVAFRHSEILGILLTLEHQRWATSEYIAISSPGRECGVSQLLYWESMIRSIQSGRKYYSMGRTSLENTGLLRFKRSWGTIEEFLTTLSYPPANSGTVTLPFFRALEQIVRFGIRSLPLPFARLLGAFIYSHWA